MRARYLESVDLVRAQRERLLAAQRAVDEQIAACWEVVRRQQEKRL